MPLPGQSDRHRLTTRSAYMFMSPRAIKEASERAKKTEAVDGLAG